MGLSTCVASQIHEQPTGQGSHNRKRPTRAAPFRVATGDWMCSTDLATWKDRWTAGPATPSSQAGRAWWLVKCKPEQQPAFFLLLLLLLLFIFLFLVYFDFTLSSNGADKEGGNCAPPLRRTFQSEAQLWNAPPFSPRALFINMEAKYYMSLVNGKIRFWKHLHLVKVLSENNPPK